MPIWSSSFVFLLLLSRQRLMEMRRAVGYLNLLRVDIRFKRILRMHFQVLFQTQVFFWHLAIPCSKDWDLLPRLSPKAMSNIDGETKICRQFSLSHEISRIIGRRQILDDESSIIVKNSGLANQVGRPVLQRLDFPSLISAALLLVSHTSIWKGCHSKNTA